MFLFNQTKTPQSDKGTSDKMQFPCPLKSVTEIQLIIDRNLDFDHEEHYLIILSVLLGFL